MFGYIYKVTNLLNSKQYVGKKYGEFNPRYYGSGKIIKQAISKYGKEHFKLELVKECLDEQDINDSETLLIEQLLPKYNIAAGGAGGNTLFLADDSTKKVVIEKRSKAIKAAWASKTPEERREWGESISNAKKGIATNTGFNHSEKSKQQIRLSNIDSNKRPFILDGVRYEQRTAAAEALGVCRSTISNYIKKGRGHYIDK